jgi:hypothetical protein
MILSGGLCGTDAGVLSDREFAQAIRSYGE